MAVATKSDPKNTTPASGATTANATRAGVQSIPAEVSATTSTPTPNRPRDTLRSGRFISSSWGSAPSGRSSTASNRPVRTWVGSRSMLPTSRSATAKALDDSPTITSVSRSVNPPSSRVTP